MISSKFTKTKQELYAFQQQLRSAEYAGQAVCVQFDTEPEFVSAMLPPCFQPDSSGKARLIAGNLENSEFRFFTTMQLQFQCLYEGRAVWYSPAGLTDSEIVLLVQREAWGESQKFGSSVFFGKDSETVVSVKREDALLAKVKLLHGAEKPDEQGEFRSVNIKGFPEMNGQGFEDGVDAVEMVTTFRKTRSCIAEASLTFRSTHLDQWGEIPILRVTGAEVFCVSGTHSAVEVKPLDNPDSYMPYHLGTKFDPFDAYTVFENIG